MNNKYFEWAGVITAILYSLNWRDNQKKFIIEKNSNQRMNNRYEQ